MSEYLAELAVLLTLGFHGNARPDLNTRRRVRHDTKNPAGRAIQTWLHALSEHVQERAAVSNPIITECCMATPVRSLQYHAFVPYNIIHPSTTSYIHQSFHTSIHLSINQSEESVYQSVNQPVNQPVNQSSNLREHVALSGDKNCYHPE